MIFNTRIKKVINLIMVGFFCGVGLTLFASTAFTKLHNKSGVGGFEIPTSPSLAVENVENLDALDFQQTDFQQVDFQQIEPEILVDEMPVLTYKTYRVKQGDMIGNIAMKNDITQDTLISVNNIKQTRLLQVGQYLKIPSIPGILYTVNKNGETFESIAKKYEISAEKCAFVNNLEMTASLKIGDTLFLPDAQLDRATIQEINGDMFKIPLKVRYRLSSPYGWRNSPFNTGKRTFHGGMDMACSTGNAIYAALEGRVSFAGYNETYGNYVIVTHHSGYKTLYGHMSQITCKTGQYVYTTTQIGKVGSTGMSTGPHLHFAVYKNGKSMNPLGVLN